MRLVLLHPKVAHRSCSDCEKWQYNEETGAIETIPGTNRPRPRPDKNLVPCRTPLGCPKGAPDAGIELTEQNWAAYEFHRECKAVNKWPVNANGEVDSIVRRNAVVIDDVVTSVERMGQRRLTDSLESVIRIFAARR